MIYITYLLANLTYTIAKNNGCPRGLFMKEKESKFSGGQIIGTIFLITFLHFTYMLFDETGLLKVARLHSDIQKAELELDKTQRQNLTLKEDARRLIEDPETIARLKLEKLPSMPCEGDGDGQVNAETNNIETKKTATKTSLSSQAKKNESNPTREDSIDEFFKTLLGPDNN